MTKDELSKYRALCIEYYDLKHELDKLESSGTSITAPIDGAPRGNIPGDKVGKCAAAMAETEYPQLIADAYGKCLYELTILQRYINSIDDPLIRVIIRQRYIYDKEWEDVAREISINHGEDSVRKMLDRYLESH